MAGMVTAWKVVPGVSVMYNLEVANDHTFTVGDGQWVVHNCGDEIESQFPDDYLSKKAPVVSPGTTTRTNVYVNDVGKAKPWIATYDPFGG